MSHRSRYFESYAFRDIVYQFYDNDKRVRWVTAPKPSMKDSMYNRDFFHNYPQEKIIDEFNNKGYKSGLLEKEMAFDAADIMRMGKDFFLRKSATANNRALDWLRREFPDLRIHLFHCQNDYTRHADGECIPLAPPSPGKEGLMMTHVGYPYLDKELDLFRENDWRVVCAPPA